MKWYLKALQQWSNFKGRASRQEFWMFVLLNILFVFAAQVIDGFLNIVVFSVGTKAYGPLYLIYSFAILVPNLAVTVRRFHDIGKSGWWLAALLVLVFGWVWTLPINPTPQDIDSTFMLLSLLVGVASIWGLVWLASKGQPGTNKWGPNPDTIPAPKGFQET